MKITKEEEKVFFVNNAKTERYRKSSDPYMQRLLNKEDRVFVLVNYAILSLLKIYTNIIVIITIIIWIISE